MASSPCFLCVSPVPARLALLDKCHHGMFHAPCIAAHVRETGRCPYAECACAVTEADVRELHMDPPQPINGLCNKTAEKGVHEVIEVIRKRLSGHPLSSDASERDFKEVENAFQVVFVDEANGWDKLVDLAKKASPFIALIILGVLCWVYWPLVVSFAGVMVENITAMVTGLAGVLRKYFPEIVCAAIGFFSIFVGKKKLAEDAE